MATISSGTRDFRRFVIKLTDATQSDGDQTIDTTTAAQDSGGEHVLSNWQLQFEPSGSPSAGTLTVKVKSPNASNHDAVGGTVDMTATQIKEFTGVYTSIQLSPSSFDGTSYDVFLVAYN